MMMESRRRE